MRTVFYDIETIKNFFSYIDTDNDGNTKEFVIHSSRNNLPELLEYMLEPKIEVGYNNLRFDSVVMAYIFDNRKFLLERSAEEVTGLIHSFVQKIINSKEINYNLKPLNKQIDLFLINHYNNKARMTSLKALQCSMYWHNVQDMPFSHDHLVQDNEVEDVLAYNLNDVLSTQKFYEFNKENIEIRETFSKIYKKDFTNKSNIAIGEEIFLHYIKKASGLTKKDLQQKVVFHKNVDLKKCVLSYVKFNSDEFKQLLSNIKNTTIDPSTKFKESIKYKGFKFDFGVGGIHGCVPAGIYEAAEDEMIIDYDVKSYYPNLAIQNNFHPLHISGEVFCSTYKQIFDERVEKQKQGKQLEQEGLKLSLNGIFGKSGEETSAFHDRYFFYRITLNGQLSLAMLSEAFLDFVPGLKILQVNTDGLTVKIKKDQLPKCDRIIERFMEKTKLIMEQVEYQKMIVRDVNNYIGYYKDHLKKPKLKGIFATSVEWHKNNSFLAIPKAVNEYFLNGSSIEKTLKENQNIYDFCGRFKATAGWSARYQTTTINKHGDSELLVKNYGKILRFYPTVSKKGTAVKVHNDGRVINLLSGWATKPFNVYEEKPIEEYNINYDYFINECEKIINEIKPKQLVLF
jgi:hypothetical protein